MLVGVGWGGEWGGGMAYLLTVVMTTYRKSILGGVICMPGAQINTRAWPPSDDSSTNSALDHRKSMLARGSRWDYKPLPFEVGIPT